ncbi:hypothetical protein ACFWA9_38425 [Kitasatospora sp. NPDC059973]|uniref:hypothetical protein n=1 Tax=Kitasatospora sp. NPDC059973 TaxID=3347020 RepID=UPI0036838D81
MATMPPALHGRLRRWVRQALRERRPGALFVLALALLLLLGGAEWVASRAVLAFGAGESGALRAGLVAAVSVFAWAGAWTAPGRHAVTSRGLLLVGIGVPVGLTALSFLFL